MSEKFDQITAFSEPEEDSSEIIYPIQCKIVDLPIITFPVVQPLASFKVKMYRRGAEEWKRMCFGTCKFVKFEEYIYVTAYQFGTCMNRLKEIPVLSGQSFNLSISEQFPYNWVFKTFQEQQISIAIQNPEEFQEFQAQWNFAKEQNSKSDQENWINFIDTSCFDDDKDSLNVQSANNYVVVANYDT